MGITQITARVNPALKKQFMNAAKKYDLPASSLLSLMMRSVAEGKRIPEMTFNTNNEQTEDLEITPALKKALQKAEAEYKA